MNQQSIVGKSVVGIFALGIGGLFLASTLAQNAPPATNPSGAGAAGAPAGPGGRGAARGGRGRGQAAPMIKFSEPPIDPVFRIDQQWSDKHMHLVELAKKGDVDLYLEGDSITDNWGQRQYAESYNKFFSGWKTADFGIGGDRTEHVLWRIKNGEMDGVKPKVIVLLVGTNNLAVSQYNFLNVTPEATADGVKLILDAIKEKQPQAKILLMSVFPREDAGAGPGITEKVVTLNGLIQKFADGKQVVWLDIYKKFLGDDGHLLPGLMNADSLHPAAPGYDIWGNAMKPLLTEWLGEPAKTP